MLFNCKGSVIPDQPVSLRDDRKVDWTLGSLLFKRHASAENVSLSVGVVDDAPTKRKRQDRPRTMKTTI